MRRQTAQPGNSTRFSEGDREMGWKIRSILHMLCRVMTIQGSPSEGSPQLMDDREKRFQDLAKDLADSHRGHFSSFMAPPTIVGDQLKADGLSRPAIATRL